MNIPRRPTHRADEGTALVIVLGLLVLLLALTIGFLGNVATERGATASYAHAAGAARLADTCVQLVQSQIEHATTRGDGTTWASQPGMVRTFNNDGSLLAAYKLYSAKAMTATDTNSVAADDLPPADWAASPAGWADVNAPAFSVDGGVTNRFFPVLNPSALGVIPGFSVDSAWVQPGALPMPVRWLYVLAGGQIVAPSSVDATGASFSGADAPTADNPIVGRIAFWTDDESCKVNVNTASAPTFFDLPMYNSAQEKQLADRQPVRGEFQRYPGHPATVDLAYVIRPLLTNLGDAAVKKVVLDTVPRLQEGGSLYGTVINRNNTASPVLLDSNRLYPSADEIRFPQPAPGAVGARTNHPQLTAAHLETLRFFLTAHSRAPELNPFGLPKVASWPLHINPAATHRTAFERLIARCASINGKPYFFQRANSQDPKADWEDIARNRELFAYLDKLFSRPIPGAGLSFESKFQADQPQILVQILDYIRCTNLYDDYLSNTNNRFTRPKTSATGTPEIGHGFVAPLQTSRGMGFGRFYTLSELAFLFICNGDGYDINAAGTNKVASEPGDAGWPAIYPWTRSTNVNTPAKRLPYENFERKKSRYGPGYAGPRDPPAGTGATNSRDNLALPAGTMLGPDQRSVQMIILPELFSPMYGYGILRPDMSVTVKGLRAIKINGTGIFPNDEETLEVTSSHLALNSSWPLGGYGGFRSALVQTRASGTPLHVAKGVPARGSVPGDPGATGPESTYALVSEPVIITAPAPIVNTTAARPAATMEFSTGNLTVEIYHGTGASAGGRKLIQSIDISGNSARIPAPNLVAFGDYGAVTFPETWWGFHTNGVVAGHPGRIHWVRGSETGTDNFQYAGAMVRGSGQDAKTGGSANISGTYARDTDVVRSFVPSHGDYRLVAGRTNVPAGIFVPCDNWEKNTFLLHALHDANWQAKSVPGAIDHFGSYVSAVSSYGRSDTAERNARFPDFPAYSTHAPTNSGDFDKGVTYSVDGPYVNKPDEGNVYTANPTNVPYFATTLPDRQSFDSERFFSPNRVIPSPGMFGSLPTHVLRGEPWRTLLFRPQPAHPNAAAPRDHLLMEFFWMPVVEPYAVSEPFSTAGKINMNFGIMPFTYIERSTALRAALAEERVTAAPNTASVFYTLGDDDQQPAQQGTQYRRKIDADQTLRQWKWQEQLAQGGLFTSASEICDLYLVPEGLAMPATDDIAAFQAKMEQFWKDHALTSDNVRERVYTTLYPKLTVRSNIYTVHYRVQTLKKRAGSDPVSWVENADQVVAEYRGADTIERYLDPNDARIPDYPSSSDPASQPPATAFYRWRTIRSLPFSP